ncbi:MAG: lipase family protein [Acidimicrobiales bacterium]
MTDGDPTEPPGAEPTAAEPTTAEPAADEPTTAEPTTADDEAVAADLHRRHHRARPVALVALLVLALLLGWTYLRIEPPAPGAFYSPPADLPSTPGTLLRTEPIAGAPPGSTGWKILYTSTGLDGQPVAVSGVVFAPTAAPTTGARDVVAWAHPTTGVADWCAPSIYSSTVAQTIPGLVGFLQHGQVVVATDYPGLGTPGMHPYLVGESEGRAVLDAVRAARSLDGAHADTRFATWGHSQGGQASLFAGQLAATYAPELQLVGVTAAAPATDLATLVNRDLGTLAGGILLPMAVVSWSDVYPGVDYRAITTTGAQPLIARVAAQCIETEPQAALDLPEAEALRFRFVTQDPTTTPPWTTYLAQNTPGATPIPAPIFIAVGDQDNVVWEDVTVAFTEQLCQRGATVETAVMPGVPHTGAGFAMADATVAWIEARFAGEPAPSTCGQPPLTLSPSPGSVPGAPATAGAPGTTVPVAAGGATGTTVRP